MNSYVHAVFAGDSRFKFSFLYALAVAPLKIALLMGFWTPFNTWFLGPTQVLNPNGVSIGSAVFAGLTTVTDRQTDISQFGR